MLMTDSDFARFLEETEGARSRLSVKNKKIKQKPKAISKLTSHSLKVVVIGAVQMSNRSSHINSLTTRACVHDDLTYSPPRGYRVKFMINF